MAMPTTSPTIANTIRSNTRRVSGSVLLLLFTDRSIAPGACAKCECALIHCDVDMKAWSRCTQSLRSNSQAAVAVS